MELSQICYILIPLSFDCYFWYENIFVYSLVFYFNKEMEK